MTRISVKQINQNELINFIEVPVSQATGELFNIIESGFAGVGSINGISGAVNLYGSGGIYLFSIGNDIYIAYTGIASGGGGVNSGINISELNSYLATGNFNLNNTVRTTGNQTISGTKYFKYNDLGYFLIDNEDLTTRGYLYIDGSSFDLSYTSSDRQIYFTEPEGVIRHPLLKINDSIIEIDSINNILNLGLSSEININGSDISYSNSTFTIGNILSSSGYTQIYPNKIYLGLSNLIPLNQTNYSLSTPTLSGYEDRLNTGSYSGSIYNILQSNYSKVRVHRLELDNVITGSGDYQADKLVIKTGNLIIQNGNLNVTGKITTNNAPTNEEDVVNLNFLTGQNRKYNKVNINIFFDFSITGNNLQEFFIEDSFIFTGYKINCWQSGAGPAHLNSGASGSIINTIMTGNLYQRGISNTKFNFSPVLFNSGLLYSGVSSSNITISGNNNIGIDILSGLSGIRGLNISLLGYLSY